MENWQTNAVAIMLCVKGATVFDIMSDVINTPDVSLPVSDFVNLFIFCHVSKNRS